MKADLSFANQIFASALLMLSATHLKIKTVNLKRDLLRLCARIGYTPH